MMHRWRAFALFLFSVLTITAGPLSAQYGDPAAENHAWSLYRAYDADDNYTFNELFRSDPLLTKKAFLFVLYFADQQKGIDPEATAEALVFAQDLGGAIEQEFGDQNPAVMAGAALAGNPQLGSMLLTYQAQLYPELASGSNTGGPTTTTQTDRSDQALQNHLMTLARAYTAKDLNTYRSVFMGDPLLTKMSFLMAFAEGVGSKNEDTLIFATTLAADIQNSLGDPVPNQLVQLAAMGDMAKLEQQVMSYASQLDGATATTTTTNTGGPITSPTGTTATTNTSTTGSEPYIYYGDLKVNASDFPAETLELIRPILVKLARFSMAMAYTDPFLQIQELDTLELALQSLVQRSGLKMSDFEDSMKELREGVEITRLQVLAQFGLTTEFGARAMKAAAEEIEVDNALGIYFIGFNEAFRQQKFTEARKYLDAARTAIAAHREDASPIYKFLAETAEFQLKVANEGQATPAQTASAFQRAWGKLANYEPIKRMTHDMSWRMGRDGVRYWVEQLSSIGEKGDDGIVAIVEGADTWATQALSSFQKIVIVSPDDLLLRTVEIQGFYAVLFATLDIQLSVFEERPELMEGVGDVTAAAADALKLGEMTDEMMNLNLDMPGFPPFSLKDSTQMQRLRVRLDFLKGLDPNKGAAQRLAALEAVLPQMEQLLLPADYIRYHLLLGHALGELQRSDLASVAWERAYRKAEEMGFVSESIEAASLLAEEYGKANQWQKASDYATKANQGLQQELGTSDSTVGLAMAKKSKDLTNLGAVAAIKSDNPQKALAMLSEGQQMNSAAAQLSGNSEAAQATKSLQTKKKQLATLSSKVQELKQMPSSTTRDEMIKKAETLLAESKSDFLLQSRKIRQKFSQLYTTALRFDPLNLPDVQAALPTGTAVVQYFATDQELYIFVVTKTEFRLRSVKETKSNLDSNIIGFLKEVQRPGMDDQKLSKFSTGLYQTLVTPIEQDLANTNTLVLIPSGKLNVLPFAALQGPDGKLFLEKKTLLELAKPTDFMKIAASEIAPVNSVVAFANATEDLPAAEKEGQQITAMFENSELFTRKEASKANLMEFGSKPRKEVLHLATHGTWDAANSLNNHLKLANNEKLSQEEIFNMDLVDTPIVTLSACSTALADTKEVEYVASLAEAFWIAGSRTVVASLWPVDDTSTGLLMTNFYTRLKAGDPKAEALRKAQLAVRGDARFSHPYYWSGFLLFGDYR